MKTIHIPVDDALQEPYLPQNIHNRCDSIYYGNFLASSRVVIDSHGDIVTIDPTNDIYPIDSIPGVRIFDTGIKGPTCIISSSVHGGEPSGRQVQAYLESINFMQYVTQGKVIFILANIEGFEKYLETGDSMRARFVNDNANRAGTEEDLQNPGTSSEKLRLCELRPILEKANMVLDIHSVSATGNAVSMSIVSSRSQQISEILNVDIAMNGIIDVQFGAPMISIAERAGAEVVGIETGSHLDPKGFMVGLDNAVKVLEYANMIDKKKIVELRNRGVLPMSESKNKKEYHIYGSYRVKDFFTFVKPFKNFELVTQGTLLGYDGENPVIATEDFVIALPAANGAKFNNEAFFMAKTN